MNGFHPEKIKTENETPDFEVQNTVPVPGAGSGWELVRWVPPGDNWHPATDQLNGTEEYGDPANRKKAFSVKFHQKDFDQFLFSTGDGQKWLIARKEQVVGTDGNAFYVNQERTIVKSSKNKSYYKARWYRRSGTLGDPWISLTDFVDAVMNNEILYGENSYDYVRKHAEVLKLHKGASVFIRKEDSDIHEAIKKDEKEKALQLIQKDVTTACQRDVNGDTLFHLAAQFDHEYLAEGIFKNCDYETVEGLLKCKNFDEKTPLDVALENNNTAVAKMILGNSCCKYWRMPLQVAAMDNNVSVAKFITDDKEDTLCDTDENGETPLHVAVKYESMDVIKLILKHPQSGKGVLDAKDKYGRTPFHLAAQKNSEKVSNLILEFFLLRWPDCVEKILHAKTNNGSTPLHIAAQHRSEKVAQCILDCQYTNAEILRCVDDNGGTPLHMAALEKSEAIAKLILNNAHADTEMINTKDNFGYTALQITALENSEAVARLLLNDKRVNVNITNKAGYTLLHSSARYNTVKIAQLVLDSGKVGVNTKDMNCKTALEIAVLYNSEDMIKLLLNVEGCDYEGGVMRPLKMNDLARIENLIKLQPKIRSMVLHLASKISTPDTVQYLVDKYRLNVNFQNSDGNTALHMATQNNEHDTISILLLLGADPNRKNIYKMRPHSMALMYNNACGFNKILKYQSPFARLDDIKYARINEDGTHLTIAQYCLAHRCDEALNALFICENSNIKTKKCSETSMCRIHKLYFNQKMNLHTIENKDKKNLLEEMATQGERLATQRDNFLTLLSQIMSKDDTIKSIKRCLKTSPYLVKWIECAQQKYYPDQQIIFVVLSLLAGLFATGLDFGTDTKVTISYGNYSYMSEQSETKTNQSHKDRSNSTTNEWSRFSSSSWSTMQYISIFHLVLPFMIFSICGITKICKRWQSYRLNGGNQKRDTREDVSWFDKSFGYDALIRDFIMETIFAPFYSKIQVYRTQKMVMDYKSKNPTNQIDPQHLDKLEDQVRAWKMTDLTNYLIEVACEISFQLYFQSGLAFSAAVHTVINQSGSSEENKIYKAWSIISSVHTISIISSVYSLTKSYLKSKKLQKFGAQNWKAQLALALSLLFEITSRICCVSFFLHLMDKNGLYRWDLGILIYYGHILLVVLFNMVFIDLPRTSKRRLYILNHLPVIILNSFCSFFTYPGFNLNEETRGHFPSFMKQTLFYTLMALENVLFMIVGFQYGYGNLMLSNGDVLHLDEANKKYTQIAISAFILISLVFRIIYYKLHPAKPPTKPSIELQIVFRRINKPEEKYELEEEYYYCPQDHQLEKFNARSRSAKCDICHAQIEGNYEGCFFCHWDICQKCLDKIEDLDNNWEQLVSSPYPNHLETKDIKIDCPDSKSNKNISPNEAFDHLPRSNNNQDHIHNSCTPTVQSPPKPSPPVMDPWGTAILPKNSKNLGFLSFPNSDDSDDPLDDIRDSPSPTLSGRHTPPCFF